MVWLMCPVSWACSGGSLVGWLRSAVQAGDTCDVADAGLSDDDRLVQITDCRAESKARRTLRLDHVAGQPGIVRPQPRERSRGPDRHWRDRSREQKPRGVGPSGCTGGQVLPHGSAAEPWAEHTEAAPAPGEPGVREGGGTNVSRRQVSFRRSLHPHHWRTTGARCAVPERATRDRKRSEQDH